MASQPQLFVQDELAELMSQLGSAVLPRLANMPAPGRPAYVLSTILFPTDERPQP